MSARPLRRLVLFALVAAGCGRTTPEERAYVAGIEQARRQKDEFFATAGGPLTPEQRRDFRGLRYYAPDPDWAVEARLVAAASPDTLQFPTSKQTFDPYLRRGRLVFQLRGRPCELSLYESVEGAHLFLPFSDRTSGRDTYGAGRYLDLELSPDGRTQLDFNRAYSPYCAYNAEWICPLSPPENALDIAVEVGEKVFEGGH